jgi:hypothetical protein
MHAEDMRRHLSEAMGRPVSLRLTMNASTMLSVRPDLPGPGVRVSMHRIFLLAPPEVLAAVAEYGRRGGPSPEARVAVRDYINTQLATPAAADAPAAAMHAPPRLVAGTGVGRHFNLAPRAAALNDRFFAGELRYRIIWGRHSTAEGRQRHIHLGTWNNRQGVIRIHPLLDSPLVPAFFVDFVIYHEMTHVAVPSSLCDGRMSHHGPAFRAVERKFPHYREAIAWENRWLWKLIEHYHGGAPVPPGSAEGPRSIVDEILAAAPPPPRPSPPLPPLPLPPPTLRPPASPPPPNPRPDDWHPDLFEGLAMGDA